MTAVAQSEKEFRRSGGGLSQNARLKDIFLSRPGEWLEMVWLGNQIGAWAVHSRVAFLRKHHEMTIECSVERDEFNGMKQKASYRFVPK